MSDRHRRGWVSSRNGRGGTNVFICASIIFSETRSAKFDRRAIIATMSENGNGTKASLWTEVPHQPKQKYCHECKKRTYYWLFEQEGAVCSDCVNLRNMAKPPAKSEPTGGNGEAKKSRSTIAPAKKIAILAKRASGASKGAISRDLGIAFNTVTKVLNENDFDRVVEQGRWDSVRLIPVALKGLELSMSKGDGNTCNRFLENVGVTGENVRRIPTPANDALMRAIVNLINPEAAKPAIEAEVVTASSSPS
jgi:hypothetical protein